MIPGSRMPDRMNAARDQIARTAEADCPGWAISHHLHGWTGTRTRDSHTETASSLPGLLALISVADTTGPPRAP